MTDFLALANLIVQIVTSLAIFFAAWQVMFHARQMHRDLEMNFVQQYWRIMEKTSLAWRETYFQGDPVTDADKLAIHRYLQLCEDEIDLRKNARVTDSTWAIWAAAIRTTTNVPAYRAVFEQIPLGLYPELTTMLNSPSPQTYDPLKMSKFWRRFRGL
jgi:hypothetical protein